MFEIRGIYMVIIMIMTEMISGLSLANDNIAFKQSATQSHTLLSYKPGNGKDIEVMKYNLNCQVLLLTVIQRPVA